MIRSRPSRYYTFTRINPSGRDIKLLVKNCKAIKADFYGYVVHRVIDSSNKRKTILEGFFVLSKSPTFSCFLEAWFPNFLIRQMPKDMSIELDELPSTLTIVGHHPYLSCRSDLFDSKLSDDDISLNDANGSFIYFLDDTDDLFNDSGNSLYPSDESA